MTSGKRKLHETEKIKNLVFREYATTSKTITQIAREFKVPKHLLYSWKRKNQPDDWEASRLAKKGKLPSLDDVQLSDSEMLRVRNVDRLLRLSDRNYSNFVLIFNHLNEKLTNYYKNDKFKNFTIKDYDNFFKLVNLINNILDKLYAVSMPDPKGYMLVNDVEFMIGMFFKHVLNLITNHPELPPDIKVDLVKSITNYADSQKDNLNRRKDLNILTIEQGRELILKQAQEHKMKKDQERKLIEDKIKKHFEEKETGRRHKVD